MMFYAWPFTKSIFKFIATIGAQTLLLPVLALAVQGLWLHTGHQTNSTDARLDFYQAARERAMAHQRSFKQIRYARSETGRDRPLFESLAKRVGEGAE